MPDQIQEILDKVDFEKFYRERLDVKSKSGDELKAICPFHEDTVFRKDTVASLSANIKNGLWHCFGCGVSGTIFQFIQKFEKVTFSEAVKILANFAGMEYSLKKHRKEDPTPKKELPPIDPGLPEKYLKNLLHSPEKLAYVKKQRGLFKRTIEKYQLGWDGYRHTIPIYDEKGRQKGKLVNIRRYDPKAEDKMVSYKKGYGKSRLYGLDEMLERPDEPIHVCAGEWDKLMGSQNKYLCVTTTTGERHWNPAWNKYFKGRIVRVIYDLDPQGREGAKLVIENLLPEVKEIKDILLPMNATAKKKDLTDFYLNCHWKDPNKTLDEVIIETDDLKVDYLLHASRKKKSASKPAGPSGGKSKEWSPHPLAEKIVAKIPLKYFTKSHHLLMYNKQTGLWTLNGTEEIRPIIREKLDKQKRKIYYVKEVVASIQDMVQITEWPDPPPSNLIPFADKIADLKTGKTLDYGSEYFFISKIKCPFIPKKIPTPNIDNFINSTLKEKDVLSLLELLSYTLYPEYPYQKMFFWVGEGGNGKSKAIALYQRVLGIENMSAVGMKDLQHQRFLKIRLYGRFINFSPEASETIIEKTDTIKSLTGGDPIEFEEKFKGGFTAVSHCKVVFICNYVPITRDSSFAFYRRVFMIHFPKKFEAKQNADPNIISKIPQEEINALAYGSFLLAQMMYKRAFPFAFTHHVDSDQMREEYERYSNPVGVFIKEKCNVSSNIDNPIPPLDFKDAFKKWQGAKGEAPWNNHRIEVALKELGHKSKSVRFKDTVRFGDQPKKAYAELEWKT